jgi:hypothetical protein
MVLITSGLEAEYVFSCNGWSAVLLLLSVTRTENEFVPALVGVPCKFPEESSVSHAGSDAEPGLSDQLYGCCPPDALSDWL